MSDAAARRAAPPHASETSPASVADDGPSGLEAMLVASDKRLVELLLMTLLVPALFYTVTDLLGTRSGDASFESRLLSRVLSVALPLAGLWAIRRAPTRQALSDAVFTIALGAVPLLLWILLQRVRGGPLPLPPLLLILMIMYGALPNTRTRQLLPPLLLSACLAGLRTLWLTAGSNADMWGALVMLAFVNVTGVIMVRRRAALQEQVAESWRAADEARTRERAAHVEAEAAARDLGVLRGIIPICSNCKHVRIGAGEWQQIESYVRDHTEADFSHGICPGCALKLYGEVLPSNS